MGNASLTSHCTDPLSARLRKLQRAGVTASLVAGLAVALIPLASASATPIASPNAATTQAPEPTPGDKCARTSSDKTQTCWTANEPVILTVKVADYHAHDPEYIVFNADNTENHRSRLGVLGINRVWLGTGESLALTPPTYSDTNEISLQSVLTQTEGPRPELDERCVAKVWAGDVSCFVISQRNYKLTIKVTGFASDPPEYVVRRNGVDQHGNRLEMDEDGSEIWIDAGDEFVLRAPVSPFGIGNNVIEITSVEEYLN